MLDVVADLLMKIMGTFDVSHYGIGTFDVSQYDWGRLMLAKTTKGTFVVSQNHRRP